MASKMQKAWARVKEFFTKDRTRARNKMNVDVGTSTDVTVPPDIEILADAQAAKDLFEETRALGEERARCLKEYATLSAVLQVKRNQFDAMQRELAELRSRNRPNIRRLGGSDADHGRRRF